MDIPDAPWTALGFSDGPVGATALVFRASRLGWVLRSPSAGEGGGGPDAVDGIATRWMQLDGTEGTRCIHPNGAVAVDHVVVATPDVTRTVGALVEVGMTLRRERDAGPTLKQAFFRDGEAIVEVVGPHEPSGDGPASLWGLTVTVADLDATAARLGALLSAPRDAVQPDRRIAPVRREAGLALAVAFMSR